MDKREIREAAKKRLQGIGYMQRRIRQLEQRRRVLRMRAEGLRGISYEGDRVQTTPHNAMEDTLLELYDLDDQYAHTIADLYAAIETMEREIDGLPDRAQKEVLKAMYLDERDRKTTLWMVAMDLHRSYDNVRHLHTAGLIAYGRMYLEETSTKKHNELC